MTTSLLVDEPEQHSHQLAQRRMSSWLRDLVRVHSTEALVITHSVSFVERADVLAYASGPPSEGWYRGRGRPAMH